MACCGRRKKGDCGCVTYSATWADPTQTIMINLGIPFNPATTFTPPPSSSDPCVFCEDTPLFSKCVFAEPGLNQATTPSTIDPHAVQKLGNCQFQLEFACEFSGQICFQFCCQGRC